MEGKGTHTGFWWENVKGRYSLAVSCIDNDDSTKMDVRERGRMWTGYI